MSTNVKFDTTDQLTVIAGSTVTAGDPFILGGALFVPLADAASGDKVACVVRGRVMLDKTASQVWALGDLLYWDAVTSKLTTAPVGSGDAYLNPMGICGEAAASADTEGWIDLGVGNVQNAGTKRVTSTFTAGQASEANAADADLIDGTVISCVPDGDSDQALINTAIDGSGVLTLTCGGNQTAAAVWTTTVLLAP